MISTTKHLAYTLKVEASELEYIIKNIDKFYYEKKEIKKDKAGNPKLKNGKPQVRILNPSTKRLKVIQKRINRNILQLLEMPEYAFGSIKGKTNIDNAKKHQGKKYIFTTDLKNFFPSVTNDRIFKTYRSLGFSPTVSRSLTQLTTYKGRLPQGAPTSPMLANLSFIKTGKKLQAFAKENQLTFTSYVDDLTFSAPVDFKPKAQFIIDTLIEDGFKISHNKTNYKTKMPIVTGLVVKNNSITVTDSFRIKLSITEGKSALQIKGLEMYAERIKQANR